MTENPIRKLVDERITPADYFLDKARREAANEIWRVYGCVTNPVGLDGRKVELFWIDYNSACYSVAKYEGGRPDHYSIIEAAQQLAVPGSSDPELQSRADAMRKTEEEAWLWRWTLISVNGLQVAVHKNTDGTYVAGDWNPVQTMCGQSKGSPFDAMLDYCRVSGWEIPLADARARHLIP